MRFNKPEVVALVPMKHSSERVPRKNLRSFAGKPLFHHIVSTLLNSCNISRVVIDTDSEEIASNAVSNFERIEIIDRSHHLRGHTISMNEILLHDVGLVDGQIFLQTHSTNPLLRTSTVDAAISAFTTQKRFDSLFSVTRLQTRLWSSDPAPLNHDPNALLRTQDMQPIYEENSNLYVFTKEALLQYGTRIGRQPMMFEIDRDESWDIDEEVDFRIAECIYSKRGQWETPRC